MRAGWKNLQRQLEGERKIDVELRYQKQIPDTQEKIEKPGLVAPIPRQRLIQKIPLSENGVGIANTPDTGITIPVDNNSRYSAV